MFSKGRVTVYNGGGGGAGGQILNLVVETFEHRSIRSDDFKWLYSIHPKAGYLAFECFAFRTLFESDFRMLKTGFKPVFRINLATILFFPTESQTKDFFFRLA
jgi:hypothetical protein